MTLGEMIDRIRTAYGLPITGKLGDADLKVIDVLKEMYDAGASAAKRKVAGEA